MSELDEEKKFYERFWSLLGDRDLMRVFERYGYRAFRRSSVLEGFEKFIVANRFQGRRCVEIGTLKGLTAAVLARHFEEVITIDIVPDPLLPEILDFLQVRNVKTYCVRNNAEKAEIIESIPDFDGAYVDGDHHRDTESDFALVRRSRKVLFHEHWAAQPAVPRLVASLGGNVTTADKWALWIA